MQVALPSPRRALHLIRGDRMLERFTLQGTPVAFSGAEWAMALWLASWWPLYVFERPSFVGTFRVLHEGLPDVLAAIIPPPAIAMTLGIIGMIHAGMMTLAWLGIARPPRRLRVLANLITACIWAFTATVGITIGAWSAAGPYAIFTLLSLQYMQRAIRNGVGLMAGVR